MRRNQSKKCLKFLPITVFNFKTLLLCIFFISNPGLKYCFCQINEQKRFSLSESRQLVIVMADKINSKGGKLYFYKRNNRDKWISCMQAIDVMLGTKGMGYCSDLSGIFAHQLPEKKEGDLKSPAGLFYIHEAFAYYPVKTGIALKILNQGTVCVDDTGSSFYGKLSSDSLLKRDWHSGEKMRQIRQYEYGFIIDQNMLGNRLAGGSCIFVHIWSGVGKTTAGCTAMSKQNLLRVLALLDIKKIPVILQLPLESYKKAAAILKLPIIN